MDPNAAIPIFVIAVIYLVIVAFEIGFLRVVLIAIAGSMLGIIGVLSGILGTIVNAITQAAAAFGNAGAIMTLLQLRGLG